MKYNCMAGGDWPFLPDHMDPGRNTTNSVADCSSWFSVMSFCFQCFGEAVINLGMTCGVRSLDKDKFIPVINLENFSSRRLPVIPTVADTIIITQCEINTAGLSLLTFQFFDIKSIDLSLVVFVRRVCFTWHLNLFYQFYNTLLAVRLFYNCWSQSTCCFWEWKHKRASRKPKKYMQMGEHAW